jgi:uncharacterized protein YjiS (DUF1127 family)
MFAGVVAFFAAVRDRVIHSQARARRLIEHQRQRRVLLGLDDHLLRDIGTSREQVLAEPFWK